MYWYELISLQVFTVNARNRLYDLFNAGIIGASDYVESCGRFSNTWQAAHDAYHAM